MRYALLVAIAITAAGWCALAMAADAPADKNDMASIVRGLEEAWAAGAAKKDAGPLDQMLSDDYTLTTPQGKMVGRSELLNRLKDGTFSVESASYSDMKVRAYGDAAVVTARMTLKAKWDDSDISGEYAITDTFIRHNDKWQQVAGQVTRVEGE